VKHILSFAHLILTTCPVDLNLTPLFLDSARPYFSQSPITMTELTPEKMQELTALMSKAPPATAARMLAMFERVKVKGSNVIPSQDLLNALREAGVPQLASQDLGVVRLPSFERLFFQPFENLFENGELSALLPGSIPRAGLKETWQHISERFIPEDVAETASLGTQAILNGDMSAAYELAAGLREALLSALKSFRNEAIARGATTEACRAVLVRLAPLLQAQAIGKDIWAMAYGSKGELSDQGVASLSTHVRALEEENPEAACELLLLTMATLPRPYEALRVLNKVSLGVDDRKLDMTEFAVIGRRVIAIAAREATAIEAAWADSQFDGKELAAVVERYNQSLHGLERESRLSHDGPWRQSVVSIRGRVGNRLELLCQRASQLLEMALPVQRLQRHTITWTYEPRLETPIDQGKIDNAIRHLEFVSAARLFAPLAGFGAPREMAAKHAINHMTMVCDAILKMLRQPHQSPHLQAWIKASIAIVEASEGSDAARVFERRVKAADSNIDAA
jgi:hypothetical protein